MESQGDDDDISGNLNRKIVNTALSRKSVRLEMRSIIRSKISEGLKNEIANTYKKKKLAIKKRREKNS